MNTDKKDQKRICGDCKACCITLAVPQMNKPENYTCRCLYVGGCGIYKDRPSSCREYECLWLHGDLDIYSKPSDCGVIISYTPPDNIVSKKLGVTLYVAQEIFPGSGNMIEAQELLTRLGQDRLIVLRIHDKRTLYGPEDLIDEASKILNSITIPNL